MHKILSFLFAWITMGEVAEAPAAVALSGSLKTLTTDVFLDKTFLKNTPGEEKKKGSDDRHESL